MTTELKQFEALQAEITAMVVPVKALRVTDFKSSEQVLGAAREVKDYINRVDKKRKEVTDPMQKRVKAIIAYADDIKLPLLEAAEHLQAELRRFQVEQERIQAEARRKADEEMRAKAEALRKRQDEERKRLEDEQRARDQAASIFGEDGDVSDEATAPEAKAEALELQFEEEQQRLRIEAQQREFDIKQQAIRGARKTWDCKVLDLSKVPREFLSITLNKPAVLAAARGGVTEIAGLEIFQVTSVPIGSNTKVPRAALAGEVE